MERIQKYLNRVYRAAVLDRSDAFQEQGLQGWQVSYILQICRKPGLTQEELASTIFVNKSSVTRQVSQLIENDFITRETDPEDRRYKRLYPTQKAQEIFPKILDYLEDWNDALTQDLSDEEQEMLLKLLKHLAKASTERLKNKNLAQLLEYL